MATIAQPDLDVLAAAAVEMGQVLALDPSGELGEALVAGSLTGPAKVSTEPSGDASGKSLCVEAIIGGGATAALPPGRLSTGGGEPAGGLLAQLVVTSRPASGTATGSSSHQRRHQHRSQRRVQR